MAYVAKEKDGGLVVVIMNRDEADELTALLEAADWSDLVRGGLTKLAVELGVQ
jgi:hypothetical protein